MEMPDYTPKPFQIQQNRTPTPQEYFLDVHQLDYYSQGTMMNITIENAVRECGTKAL